MQNYFLFGGLPHKVVFKKEKKTYTFRGIEAHATKSYKLAAMKPLFNRGKRMCSNDSLYEEAVTNLTTIFEQNGYDKNIINTDVQNKV